MAEREELQKRYAYSEMSNKVVSRGSRGRMRSDGGSARGHGGGDGQPTGEVESLWKVLPTDQLGRMGDRVGATQTSGENDQDGKKKADRPAEVTEMMERAAKRRKKKDKEHNSSNNDYSTSGRKGNKHDIFMEGGSILDNTINSSGGGGTSSQQYRPTNPQSRSAYEQLLNIISQKQHLGNQSTSILHSALEEVLNILKSNDLRDPDKKDDISKLLTGRSSSSGGGLNDVTYSKLVGLGKSMNDYTDYTNRNDGNINENEDGEDGRENVDDEMGVAVVFDDSEDEEDEMGDDDRSDVEEDVVVDVDDSSDDEMGNNNKEDTNNQDDMDGDEERMVQGNTKTKSSKKTKGASSTSATDIIST